MRPAYIPDELRVLPFTLAQAKTAGLGRDALQAPHWRRLLRGVWVHADVPDTRELRLTAARLVLPPGAVYWLLTAAWLYGADIRSDDDLDVHACMPPGQRVRSQSWLRVCEASLTSGDVHTAHQLALTSPVRTVVDCLRSLDELEAVIAADALIHLRCTSVEAVATYLSAQKGLRNRRVAEARLALIEPQTESPMETRLRLLLRRAGLPPPEPQWNVEDGKRFVARLDFAWPSVQVAIEYDGAPHWRQRRADDRRRAAARALGWHIDVVSAEDYWETPSDVVNMVRQALNARGLHRP